MEMDLSYKAQLETLVWPVSSTASQSARLAVKDAPCLVSTCGRLRLEWAEVERITEIDSSFELSCPLLTLRGATSVSKCF